MATLWLAVRFWLIELALIVVEDVLVVEEVVLVVDEELAEELVVELPIEFAGIVDEMDVVGLVVDCPEMVVVVEVAGELTVVVGRVLVVFPIVEVVFREVVRFLIVVVMELVLRVVVASEELFVEFSGILKVLDSIL